MGCWDVAPNSSFAGGAEHAFIRMGVVGEIYQSGIGGTQHSCELGYAYLESQLQLALDSNWVFRFLPPMCGKSRSGLPSGSGCVEVVLCREESDCRTPGSIQRAGIVKRAAIPEFNGYQGS
jgi:hypothetical protein